MRSGKGGASREENPGDSIWGKEEGRNTLNLKKEERKA